MADAEASRTLVVACGALVRELRAVLAQVPNAADRIDVVYLPANLHNTPDRIPGAVENAVVAATAGQSGTRVFVAYADCGTGGRLDAYVDAIGATRLPGAHCYEFFAGSEAFAEISAAELGTFFLTDFLARNFDALVVRGLGLDRHPELRDIYFGRYSRVTLLSQAQDPEVIVCGRRAAETLGLAFDHVPTGLAPFAAVVHREVA